jgi:pimeloyl-ACP methyl ester carboxylesterase
LQDERLAAGPPEIRRVPPKARAVLQQGIVHPLPSGGALRVEGPPGAPGLLLLHGVGGGAWSWRPQRESLARDFRLYTWEARGHGAAGRVADAGLGDYYKDAREGLAASVADLGAPAAVVGHSMGGLLAMALAADEPEQVSGLFLIDPVYANGEDARRHHPPGLGWLLAAVATPLAVSMERDGALSRGLGRWLFSRSFENQLNMERAWLDQRTQVPLEFPRMLREAFEGPEGFDVRDFALEIGCPTYVLEGSSGKRRARFPQLVSTLGARLGERFTYEAIAGGHYLQLDRPEAVTGRLRAFLERYAGVAEAAAGVA